MTLNEDLNTLLKEHLLDFTKKSDKFKEDESWALFILNLITISNDMKKDYDGCIAIDGKKRRGKSTLAWFIAVIVMSRLHSRIWYCYTHKDLMFALLTAGKYDIIIADESIDWLFKGEWNSRPARAFIKAYDKVGFKNLLFILIMPEFNDMTKGFREARVDIRLKVYKRGSVDIYKSKETRYAEVGKPSITWPKKPALNGVVFPQAPKDFEDGYRKIKEQSFKESLENPEELDKYLIRLCKLETTLNTGFPLKIKQIYQTVKLPQRAIADFQDVDHKTVGNEIKKLKEM